MTDSLTESDIDRIYGRITSQIDLSKVRNKKDWTILISKNPRVRSWNRKLNDFFWDIHTKSQDVIEAVPEIEEIPAIPREKLTPLQKRRETLNIKQKTINVNASIKQKAYTRLKGRIWTIEEINFAKKLRKDGLSYRQIGDQLKRGPSSISTKLSRIRML